MCVYSFLSCVSWPDWLAWKLRRAGDLFVRIWLFISFVWGWGWGVQITTHVVLSVIALRLQGNSLSSSCRPPICCCPFVLNSIHRSENDNRLWRFLSLVFSPAFDRMRSDQVLTGLLVFSCCLFVLYCNNYQNGCTECGCTHSHVRRGSCRWRAQATDHQQGNQWWHAECGISSKRVWNLLDIHSNENQVFDNLRKRKSPLFGLLSLLQTCRPYWTSCNVGD